jgi:hypothetical protein
MVICVILREWFLHALLKPAILADRWDTKELPPGVRLANEQRANVSGRVASKLSAR